MNPDATPRENVVVETGPAPDNRAGSQGRIAALDRPFHIIVVLWGERFRDYFLHYCLPSLMSPGNIPALSTRQQSKLLIATRPEDWDAMRASPIFRLMEQYLLPVFIEIPPCPANRSGCEHMGIGHKLACEMAYQEKAYAAVLTPDCVLADGSFARLQQFAQSGVEVVLAAALRFGEEPLFAHLREKGALPGESEIGNVGPLSISCRDLTYAAVNSFHSHSASCEWDCSYFPHVAHCAWWRVPNEDGVLLHSLSWAPLLIDYAIFASHDTSTMDQWTIDGDYLYKNLDDARRVHVVQDSDELFIASWAPLADRPVYQVALLRLPYLGSIVWRSQFKGHYESWIFDPLKRKLFVEPVRWHSRPLNSSWAAVEAEARQQLRNVIGSSDQQEGRSGRTLSNGVMNVLFVLVLPLCFVLRAWVNRGTIGRRLLNAVRGDRDAQRYVLLQIRTHLRLGLRKSGNA
jgi:hypothetical protein